MIRLTLLSLYVFLLSVYAWKDWYKSLCALILLMAFIEHPDMPKTIFGIQGLNPWNLGFLCVFLAWLANRRREGHSWDMPRNVSLLMLLYLAVILVSFARMMADRSGLGTATTDALVSEHLINSIKWVLPGLMLFDGCRDEKRFKLALYSLLGIYFLLGIQVIKWMPFSAATSGEGLTDRSLKILSNEIGYHRVNLSMMLAGASWAILAAKPLVPRGVKTLGILLASVLLVYAQALTAGRAGYLTWAAVGLFLCFLRWRKYLLLAPVVAAAILIAVPGVEERISLGFSPETRDSNVRLVQPDRFADPDAPDLYTITAGRNVAWPFVIDRVKESPFVGHGRLAMQRTGLEALLWNKYGERFGHPHNAYLEMLLENGLVGFLVVVLFYIVIVGKGISLFRDSGSAIFIASGGVVLALALSLLVASTGSQTFYPREGAVGMWCAIGLMLRVWTERSKAFAADSGAAPSGITRSQWVVKAGVGR